MEKELTEFMKVLKSNKKYITGQQFRTIKDRHWQEILQAQEEVLRDY